MKWNEAFPNPDLVGASEYLAIYETIAGVLATVPGFKPDQELSPEALEMIKDVLGEFRAWTDRLQVVCGKGKPRKVVIHVEGGVADPVEWPVDVVVEIRDYYTEGCDPKTLAEDGSVVGTFTKEDGK